MVSALGRECAESDVSSQIWSLLTCKGTKEKTRARLDMDSLSMLFPIIKLYMEPIILCNFNCLVAVSFPKLFHDKLHSAYQTHLGEKSSSLALIWQAPVSLLKRRASEDFVDLLPVFRSPFQPRLCSGERLALLSLLHADRLLTHGFWL